MIDPEMLKNLITKCPINIEIPEFVIERERKEISMGDSRMNESRQEELLRDIKDLLPKKSETPRAPNVVERSVEQNLQALKRYFREFNESHRSSNIDDTNRTLSVLDETEINDVLKFFAKEAKVADSVWGDIFRNKFLLSLKDAPKQLTPSNNEDYHPSLKADEIRQSRLYISTKQPDFNLKKAKKAASDLSLSARVQCSHQDSDYDGGIEEEKKGGSP